MPRPARGQGAGDELRHGVGEGKPAFDGEAGDVVEFRPEVPAGHRDRRILSDDGVFPGSLHLVTVFLPFPVF